MARRLPFDSPVGLAVRRHCAPLLGLPRHSPAGVYLARRSERGAAEVNRRFLRAARTGAFCVDTGYAPHRVTAPAELAEAAGARAYEVVRLEGVAEAVAAGGVEPDAYARAFRTAAWEAVRRPGVVAVKSVAAYRTGFGLDPARPSPAEVTEAARRWLARGGGRLDDPVLVRHLLWTAVDLGRPLQLHAGFGDSDIRLHRADPTLLTDWLHLTAGTIPVLLLHCWPYQRQAAYLCAVFERVYLDVGLTLHHVGPRGRARSSRRHWRSRRSASCSTAPTPMDWPSSTTWVRWPSGRDWPVCCRSGWTPTSCPSRTRCAWPAGSDGTMPGGSTGCPADRRTTAERRGTGHSPGAPPGKHERLKV